MRFRFFHYSLPKYLMRELEHVQKRAMSIICPGRGYNEALDIMNLKELAIHHDEICETLFDTIVNDNNHRLYKLLPAAHETTYLLNGHCHAIWQLYKKLDGALASIEFQN